MELIIQKIVEKITSSYEKELINLLQEKKDISQFILNTKKALDEIGTMLVAEALETVDEAYRSSKERKRSWNIKSKDNEKTLATIFGEVRYKRTYYQNKKTKEYCYLSDEAVGIEVHDRLDASLKAKLIEEAIFMPYSQSGKKATEAVSLTSQTVMNSIRELGSVENYAVEIKQGKKAVKILYIEADEGGLTETATAIIKVKILYIEADEDHVALQSGGYIEPKLVYVHEGLEKISKGRMKLKNPRYFGGVYSNSDELWLGLADYLYQAYDVDSIEKVYLSGDSAAWIKNGLSFIKKVNMYWTVITCPNTCSKRRPI
ncbi:MAG: hypothetical protein GX767_04380 [Firmicutes bacterium]|nr:hypothetical protein [Bacillota bacterium]